MALEILCLFVFMRWFVVDIGCLLFVWVGFVSVGDLILDLWCGVLLLGFVFGFGVGVGVLI